MVYRIRNTKTAVGDRHATKVVLLPATDSIDETEAQRNRRLKAQAAANRVRTTRIGHNHYKVTSLRRTATGERGDDHEITAKGGKWLCSCTWGRVHEGNECAGVAQLRAYLRKKHMPEFPELTEAEQRDRAIDAKLEAQRLERAANRRRFEWHEEV